jgi:small basic protein (TIGR04137 family)
MSIDPSLRFKGALKRHRNVLSRAERIEKLIEEEKWTEEEDSVLGLPKVAHRKSHAGRKDADEKAEAAAEEATEATADESAPTTEPEKTES